LAIFKSRFPTRQAILRAFMACVFPIHVWSIVNILRTIPSWILSMDIWQLIGVIAYTQAFALLESVLVFLILLFIAIILPRKWFRDRFVAQVCMAVLFASAWAILAHFYGQNYGIWAIKRFLLSMTPLLVLIIVFSILIIRFKGFQKVIDAFVEHLLVLSLLYVGIDVFSIIVILFRNW
jgi:hypothetical protein